jgi:hypothetical protein
MSTQQFASRESCILSPLNRNSVTHYPLGIVRPRVHPNLDHAGLPTRINLGLCEVRPCADKGVIIGTDAYFNKSLSNQFGLVELLALKERGEDFFLNKLLPCATRYSKRVIGWRSVSWHAGQIHAPVLSFDVSQGPIVYWWSLKYLRLDCDCFEILLG